MFRTEPIMLIESNSKDAVNILSILKSQNEKYKCFHYRTTEEALEYLNKEDMQPQLILLGLKNLDSDGIEFLRNIKTDDQLKKISVVIMASSSDQNHVLESFNFGVAGYITKSQDISEFTGTISTIMKYWSICELPSGKG